MTFTHTLRQRLRRSYIAYFRLTLCAVRGWLWWRHDVWRPLLRRLPGKWLENRWVAKDRREQDRMIRLLRRMTPDERWANLRRLAAGFGADDNAAFNLLIQLEPRFASQGRTDENSA